MTTLRRRRKRIVLSVGPTPAMMLWHVAILAFLVAGSSLAIVINAADIDNANSNVSQQCAAFANTHNNATTTTVKWQRPFMVAVLADPQIGFNRDGYNSEELLKKAAFHLGRLQPDFILIAGDLIQDPGSMEQLDIVKSILDTIPGNIPYYVISGNHDVRNIPQLEMLNGFVSHWNTPYYWYSVEYYNTLFVLLESNILRAPENQFFQVSDDIKDLAKEELEWLDATIQTAQYDHVVPIAHHPMATRNSDEDSSGQNVPRRARKDIMDLYHQHPNITYVLAGHIHNRARVRDNIGIDYVTYPATGVIFGREENRKPSGFAFLTVDGSFIQQKYYGYDDMPSFRWDIPDASFTITHPGQSGGPEKELTVYSSVCIIWTSKSMTNRVRVEYTVDRGSRWSLIGEGPNHGVYLWNNIPVALAGNEVQFRISSVYDAAIFGVSQMPSRIAAATSIITTVVDDAASTTTTTTTVMNDSVSSNLVVHDDETGNSSSSSISSNSVVFEDSGYYNASPMVNASLPALPFRGPGTIDGATASSKSTPKATSPLRSGFGVCVGLLFIIVGFVAIRRRRRASRNSTDSLSFADDVSTKGLRPVLILKPVMSMGVEGLECLECYAEAPTLAARSSFA